VGVYVIFLLTAVLAFALALYLAPSIIAAAHRYGILDRPDGNLKVQRDAVPYLGGLVVFLGMLAALAVTQTFNERLLALLLGASLIVSVGLVDDLGTLTPKDKFLGQVLCGVILVKGGISVQLEAVPSWVAAVASVLWMVTIINAFNIIDVSDGLCAGVGAVCAALLGAWQLTHGALAEAFLCAALFGALCGFLRHNWTPARMYLGDTGSMLIGTILGAVAMMSSWSGSNPLAPLVSPLAVLAVPLFDITFVVLVRLILGLRIYHGSPDHFAVRLRRHGWSAAGIATLAMVGGLCTGLLGLLAAYGGMSTAAVVGAGGILAAHVVGALLWRLDPRNTVTVPPPAEPAQVPVDVVRP